jgi:hypothetical protein
MTAKQLAVIIVACETAGLTIEWNGLLEARQSSRYWFNSRRRFLKSFGLFYSISADIAAICARSIGTISCSR